MTDVISALHQRRAVKHFDPNHKMPAETRERLLEAVLLTPSAFNIQNYRLVEVQDTNLRKSIRAVAWDQAQITDASLLYVICGDLSAWKKNPARYWAHAPKPVQDFLVPGITTYYQDKAQVQRDEAMRSAGLIGMSLMLAAKDLGYDSCPMDGFDFDAVAKLINLPADHVVCFIVTIGKGIKDAWPRGERLPRSETVIVNRF